MIVPIYIDDEFVIENGESYAVSALIKVNEKGNYSVKDVHIIKDTLCENCDHSISSHNAGGCGFLYYSDDRGSKICSCGYPYGQY